MSGHRLYPEAPHTGLELAIANLSAASRQNVDIRPDALRDAARQLNELAEHYDKPAVEIAA